MDILFEVIAGLLVMVIAGVSSFAWQRVRSRRGSAVTPESPSPPDRSATATPLAEALATGAVGGPTPTSLLPAGNGPAPNNLPRQRTSFVGREGELADCGRLLGEAQLLTLTGVGGSGKTRLALRLAENVLGSYPDGAWFVDLSPLAEGSRVVDALAVDLGLREEPGRTLTQTLTHHVRGKRMLLILDNCEHVLEASASLVDQLLAAEAGLRVLATSREALGIAGERAYLVRSLSLPAAATSSDPAAVESSEAVRLFVERACVVHGEFALTPKNAGVVADICRRLDGIPLAIELAAARVKLLSVEEIRARLDDRFRLLTGGSRTLPRHQTLRATIQWSYDQLGSEEQRLFRLLAVFADGWTLEAATAVAGEGADELEVLEMLTHLVDKSLVMVDRLDGGTSRYQWMETFRQFAHEKLNAGNEGEAARMARLAYFVAWAEEREEMVYGSRSIEWLAPMEREHENVLAALEVDDRADLVAQALRLAGAVWRYWYIRGLIGFGRERLTSVLRRPGAEAATYGRAKSLAGLGTLSTIQGAYDEGRSQMEESRALFQSLGDRLWTGRVWTTLGALFMMQNEVELALPCFDGSLGIARELGDRRTAAVCLGNLAEAARVQGNLELARERLVEALAEARAAGYQDGVATFLLNSSMVELALQQVGAARHLALEAVPLVRELRARRIGTDLIDATGALAAEAGDHGRSARFYGATRELYAAMGVTREAADEAVHAPREARNCEALGDEFYQRASREGGTLRYEAALDEAEAWLRAAP